MDRVCITADLTTAKARAGTSDAGFALFRMTPARADARGMNICSGCWMPGTFGPHVCRGTVQRAFGTAEIPCACSVDTRCAAYRPALPNWDYPEARSVAAA